MRKFYFVVLMAFLFGGAEAARLKDIANIRGVRGNQLVGYGLVVGLSGTGDNSTEYTNKSLIRLLDQLGMKLGKKGTVASKNVAAVLVTAHLPAFARAGNKVDVTVSSLGNASSLKGGTLIQTPLRAADQKTYVVAQGSVLTGHSGLGVHETVARVPNGGLIERDVGAQFSNRKMFRLTLNNPDFTTAARIAKTINGELGGSYAAALDGSTVNVNSPPKYEGRGVELLAMIESVQVQPDMRARVIVNEKTGTVVVGGGVKVSPVAISHGDLTLEVGRKTKGERGQHLFFLEGAARVEDIVNAMNKMGVTPKDLITVLQSVKAAGALQADLEIL